jgi:hypothetical protein
MWYNPIMLWLLRSPLHGMLSGNTLVITYTGRKSGKVFSTPVNYVRDVEVLWTVSYRRRTWWRNGGLTVTSLPRRRINGQTIMDQQRSRLPDAYLRQAPQIAKYIV